jgi:hypothetical protein
MIEQLVYDTNGVVSNGSGDGSSSIPMGAHGKNMSFVSTSCNG